MTTTNQDVIKAAAKRMCAEFASKNIQVPHTLMLETLAKGMGLDCWRELKAVIDAPRLMPTPPVGVSQRWEVGGAYSDGGFYEEAYEGRTPLEAAYRALVDLRTTKYSSLILDCVRNSNKEAVLCSSPSDPIDLEPNEDAFRRVLNAAKLHAPSPLPVVFHWASAVLEHDLVERKRDPLALDATLDFLDWMTETPTVSNGILVELEEINKQKDFPQFGIVEGWSTTPAQAIEEMCLMVESANGGIVALESKDAKLANAVHQLRAICLYMGKLLSSDPARFEYSLALYDNYDDRLAELLA